MQRILFLDYMDGTKEMSENRLNEEEGLRFYLTLFKIANKIKFDVVEEGIEFDATEFEVEIRKLFPEKCEQYIHHVKKEKTLFYAFTDYSKVYNNPMRKNYVFSKNLSKILSETKIEQDTTIFDDERSFYFEMPGVKCGAIEFQCAYGFTIRLKDRFLLVIHILIKNNNSWDNISWPIEIKEGQTLNEEFNRSMKGELIESLHGKGSLNYDDNTLERLILNGIIYIYNNSEEMNEKINEFSPKKSKFETEKKIYTDKAYVELGKDFIFLKLIQDRQIGVKGHFRWQPCGERRRQVKLTYITSHSRNIKRDVLT